MKTRIGYNFWILSLALVLLLLILAAQLYYNQEYKGFKNRKPGSSSYLHHQ